MSSMPTQSKGNALQICDSSTGHSVANVAFCDTPERAEAITRACNSHDDLVARVNEMYDALNAAHITIDVMHVHLSVEGVRRAETDLRNRGLPLDDTRSNIWSAISGAFAALQEAGAA